MLGNVEGRPSARGFTVTKSYNQNTGVLQLGGTAQTIILHRSDVGYWSWASDAQNFTCFAYLILGNIENI